MFYAEESEEHPGYFSFRPSKYPTKFIVHNGDKMAVASGEMSNKDFMKKALFNIHGNNIL